MRSETYVRKLTFTFETSMPNARACSRQARDSSRRNAISRKEIPFLCDYVSQDDETLQALINVRSRSAVSPMLSSSQSFFFFFSLFFTVVNGT